MGFRGFGFEGLGPSLGLGFNLGVGIVLLYVKVQAP